MIAVTIKNLQPSQHRTAIVMIVDGEYAGQKGYVTYVDENYQSMRVTPVGGDPLASITFQHDQVHFVEFKTYGNQ